MLVGAIIIHESMSQNISYCFLVYNINIEIPLVKQQMSDKKNNQLIIFNQYYYFFSPKKCKGVIQYR